MSESSHLELWFDGSCEPINPGGTSACGWVIYKIEGPEREKIASGSKVVKRGGPTSTNNYAEWCGLGCGLRWLLDNMKDECEGSHLIVYGDSKLVINQLTDRWKCKKSHLQELKTRCREILDQLGFESLDARWIPREQNAEADRLSRR